MDSVTGASPAVTLDRAVPARGLGEAVVMRVFVPVATMLTIGGLALLVLLTPLYIHPVLDLSGAPATLGLSAELTHEYSDKTIADLVFGPGTFDFAGPAGTAFYSPDERSHMRDVRTVLNGFLALSALGAVLLTIVLVRRRAEATVMRAIGRGGVILVVGTLVLGVFAAVAFDAAFELFHRLLFPGGNFSFDPTTQRLVQLYPFAFWQLSAAALGILLIAGGSAAWFVGRRRANTASTR
jgi:integral membrane protein (TIGR01906 family)